VLGAFASAGDMMAITGIQMTLMLNIGATYGRDPDLSQIWELLPIVGGGFGWRALARELAGFIPVGGIFIKAAIGYAGTVVVGEGVTYYYRHGRQMGSTTRRASTRTRKHRRSRSRATSSNASAATGAVDAIPHRMIRSANMLSTAAARLGACCCLYATVPRPA